MKNVEFLMCHRYDPPLHHGDKQQVPCFFLVKDDIAKQLILCTRGTFALEDLFLDMFGGVVDILGGKARKGVSLEAQGSSMGLYSTRWLQQFHIISSGISLPGVLPLPPAARANKAWAQAVSRKESEKWPPIKLLFPSDRWVKKQSIQGPLGALTFFGKARQSVEKG